MYGLNRLHLVKNLHAHFTAAAAASPIRLHRLNPPFAFTHSSCRSETADIDTFVYLEKGYKICEKDKVVGPKMSIRSAKACKLKIYKNHISEKMLQSRNVARLTCDSAAYGGSCDVYLIGTNHVCPKSWQEAQSLIKMLKPQVVFFELCSDRLECLTLQKIKSPRMGEMLDMWKKNEDPSWFLFEWFQAKLGGENLAGGEFRVVYEEVMRYGGQIILGDRPYHITVHRILAKMSLWKFLFHPHAVIKKHILNSAKDELDIVNLTTQEMSKKFPNYTEIIIYERDREEKYRYQTIAARLMRLSSFNIELSFIHLKYVLHILHQKKELL